LKLKDVLPYGKQWIDDEDIREVVRVLKSDFLTQGPRIDAFERSLSDYVGSKYAVAVSSGTAALHLAVKALGITGTKQGITSPNTFVASANCLVYNGLEPNFADIDERTYNLSPVEIEKRIGAKTGVIVPVHFGGQPAEMERISEIAARNSIYIIEDASHALGSRYENGRRVGCCCFSHMTTFSFHPVKTITTGEGGAVTTNDKDTYEKLSTLRNHGITKAHSKFTNRDSVPKGPWYYEMQELGFNYRMTDIQAGLGSSQLRRCDDLVKRRKEIADNYRQSFKNVEWITIPYESPGTFSAYHLYVIKIDFEKIGKTRGEIVSDLKKVGISTQVHYIPVHLQPYYADHFGFKLGDFPKAEEYYQQCLSIPLHPKMHDEEVDRVIRSVKQLY
jgi:UDP-4-amino-4,6-dideoxy-N-acetyl-beta-L-altrosamine transaminase